MTRHFLMAAAAGLLLGAATLLAQAPQGEPKLPKALSPEEKTAQMAQDYDLTPEQEAAVLELNKLYDGKLEFRPEGFPPQGERKDPRQMSESERQQFFAQMQERMAQMQERQQQMEKDQKAYDKAIKGILDKEQFKAYKKDQREREKKMQERMGGGPRGFGGPGGGGFPPRGMGGGGFGGGFEM